MNDRELITQRLTDLIGAVFDTCYGAYGAADGDGYTGQFEHEIEALADAIVMVLEKSTDMKSIDLD